MRDAGGFRAKCSRAALCRPWPSTDAGTWPLAVRWEGAWADGRGASKGHRTTGWDPRHLFTSVRPKGRVGSKGHHTSGWDPKALCASAQACKGGGCS